MRAIAKRKCKGSNAKGQHCGAAPLSGSEWCRAHDPNVPESDRFGSPEQSARAGASPKPSALKLRAAFNAAVEEQAGTIVAKALEALLAEKGVMVGRGDEAFVELVPDYPVRLRAFEAIWDRAVGKPSQAVELSGPDGGPIQHAGADLSKLTDEQIAALEAIHADDPE